MAIVILGGLLTSTVLTSLSSPVSTSRSVSVGRVCPEIGGALLPPECVVEEPCRLSKHGDRRSAAAWPTGRFFVRFWSRPWRYSR